MQNYLQSEYDLTDPDIASVLDDLPLWSAPFGLKLLNVVKLRPKINVLDIGSGTGFPLIELAQRLGPSCQVYGIDPWKEAVDRIKLKIKTWNITNVHIIEGKAEALEFPDRFFDLIVSNNGTNNVESEEKTFAEMARVAKPGAQLVITLNLKETMIEFYEVFEKILAEEKKTSEIERLKEHIFTKRKPIAYTQNIIEQVGFQIKNVYQDAFNLRFIDGSTMLNHSLIKLGFMPPWKNIVSEKDLSSIFKSIEKELNNQSKRKGELSLSIPWVCLDCIKPA